MNKYLACLALSALVVAMLTQSLPIQRTGAELSPEELAAAEEMSEVAFMPEKDQEYKNNKVPEFNGYCTAVHELVFNKFNQAVTDTKMQAWKSVFDALSPAAVTAAQLQALISATFQTSMHERFNVPEEVRSEVPEVQFDNEQLQQAIENLNNDENAANKSLFARIREYISTGVGVILSSVADQARAGVTNLKEKARDYALMIQKVEEACDAFKDNLSKPVNGLFHSYKAGLVRQPNSEHLKAITQKDVKCVTAGRIQSLETFCKSAPALMPVLMSFIPQ